VLRLDEDGDLMSKVQWFYNQNEDGRFLRIVLSLGGNAIQRANEQGTFPEQIRNVRIACGQIAEIVARGHQLAITHGNGPQVGSLAVQQEKAVDEIPPQPLHVLGAMTEGQIGYILQQTLINAFGPKSSRRVSSLVTQMVVNKDDPAFMVPSKPIGPFYDEETATNLSLKRGYVIKKVKPTGRFSFRRVVASPDPVRIVEADSIKALLELGTIVISCGGGGVPVVQNERGEYEGVDAVIDKDLATERLAESVRADLVLTLTDVSKVKLNFGKPDETSLDRMTLSEAHRYFDQGQFLAGSMSPKVLAAMRFVEWGGKRAVIASLEDAVAALDGKAGTEMTK
jgi:carbamate kinase